MPWEQGVAGSSPAVPTSFFRWLAVYRVCCLLYSLPKTYQHFPDRTPRTRPASSGTSTKSKAPAHAPAVGVRVGPIVIHQRFCPRGKGRKLYRLEDGWRRCSSCRYTFQDFSDRWINRGNFTAGKWLRLIKLFELELSTRKIAQQLGFSYLPQGTGVPVQSSQGGTLPVDHEVRVPSGAKTGQMA